MLIYFYYNESVANNNGYWRGIRGSIYEFIFKSQKNYAKRYEYDFKIIREHLDKENIVNSTISFNKILVCNQTWSYDYDFIVL